MEGELKLSTATQPPSEIKIRADLEDYFEVESYAAGTLRCKLAGRNDCKIDGKVGVMTCKSSRGWYNFERHLVRVHKFPKEMFIKSKTQEGADEDDPNRPSPNHDRCCFACLSKSPVDDTGDNSMDEDIIRHFPGCEGSSQLSRELFQIFFLSVVNYPKGKWERLLKSCKGVKTPETWFFLCVACKTIVLKASTIHQKIMLLEKQLENVKNRMKTRFQDTANSDRIGELNKVEIEIRKYVCENSANGHHQKRRTSPTDVEWPPDNKLNAEGPVGENNDTDWDPKIKVETVDTVLYPDEDLQQSPNRQEDHQPSLFMDFEVEDNKDLDQDYTPDAESDELECNPNQSDPIFEANGRKRNKTVPISTGSETDFGSRVLKIRADLEEYFEVENYAARTFRCKLSGKDECKIDGKTGALTYSSSRSGWYNFQRHLTLVHNFPKKTFLTDRIPKATIGVGKTKEKHENWDSSSGTFVCKMCPATYPTFGYFNRHLRDHDRSKNHNNEFDCRQCGYPCLSSKSREIHITLKHRKEEERRSQLACSLCPVVASSKKKMVIHMREHRQMSEKQCINGKFYCKFCNRLFLSYALLCRHKRNMHHKELGWEPIVCTICSRVFSTQKHLKDHVQQTHNKDSRFYCDVCGRGFLYMSKLKRHLNSHARENQYVCEICGADFLYSETLRWHVKKDHPGSAQAGNSMTSDYPLKIDEASDVSVSVQYTCKHCNAELGSSTLLSRHLKSHTELFQHKCDLCGKHYATPQSLRRHLDINHAGKQIPCPYCEKTFSHQEYVRAHYRYCQNHPDRRESVKALGDPLNV